MGKNNVLIIGGGGREHALTWKLAQSNHADRIFVAPGNPGISQVAKATVVVLKVTDFTEVANFCHDNQVALVVIGPEDPLANGIADHLLAQGIKVFGPTKNGALIESDKAWAKAFMDRHGIPTARWRSFTEAPEAKDFVHKAPFPALVVKASGLAAGKGVVVAENAKEACDALDEVLTRRKFGDAGAVAVVEELLTGPEVSVLAFCDGERAIAMLPAQDHKRALEGDKGPNTGGMGAYCPCPLLTKDELATVQEGVLTRTMEGFKKEGIKFVGVLYAGLMLTPSGPRVLEFNCRFGDPETEVILPLLSSDLYEVMLACCHGNINKVNLSWKRNTHAVGVVMASRGYPETSSRGDVITGLDHQSSDNLVFHCGTAVQDDKVVTAGGRVLIAVSLATDLVTAVAKSTRCCHEIHFEGRQFRKDIAARGVAAHILAADGGAGLTYKDSGVDITAGNDLVTRIKPAVSATRRSGMMGSLGGFGGLFDVKGAGFVDPILVSGTDGVGTKLKIAHQVGIHDTIGIDLVAMCVNDVLAHGAEPLFFLDYYACGRLDVDVASKVVEGVAEGCKRAGCALVGGETAEMPDMYSGGDYDVAGFAVGAVERSQLIPRTESIESGDVVIGLPSSGIHSNGFSLVRKVMDKAKCLYTDSAPWNPSRTIGEELLTPTSIYVKTVIPAIRSGTVKAFAHITGGGLTENIPRVLPDNLGVRLDADKWVVPPVFAWMASVGGINQEEMLRTFNCGIGGILVVKASDSERVLGLVGQNGGRVVGTIVDKFTSQVDVSNFATVMSSAMLPYLGAHLSHLSLAPPPKRVGVLISGSGTNLQALIDSMTRLNARIVLVISNKADVEGLKRAARADIPTQVIDHRSFADREAFDLELDSALRRAEVEFVCLAGFMRILTGGFTRKWRGKLINVHPALLPSFKGVKAQQQALEAGVRVSGCTVHFVEEGVDEGGILVQEVVAVESGDSVDDLIERIKGAEHRAYPRALELLIEGRVQIGEEKGKVKWVG